MIPTFLPRLLGLGLVVLVAAAGVPVATAQTPTDDCPGAGSSVVTGNIEDPDEGQVVPAASTSIRGCFEYGSDVVGPLGTISKVTISLLAGRGQVLPGGSSNVVLFEGTTRAYRFAWSTPALPWNGPYTAKVVVEGSARPPGGRHPNVTAERRFSIETPPAPPAGIKAVPEGEEGVTVTWEKNKEPDIVLYEVHRAPRGGDFIPVAQAAANLTTLNDRPSVGDWRYVVVAIRRGAGNDGIASGPSNEAEAAVVVPPAPSTTTTAPGGDGGAGGGAAPPTTLQKSGSGIVISSATTGAGGAARPAGGGKVDLSRFGSLGRSTTRQIDPPDQGFEETLPFDPGDQPAVAPEEEMELGADDPNRDQAVGQGLISDESDRRRSLTFVAFGLLLFVMSMAGLWVRGEVKRADELEALEPMPAPPPEGGPPSPRPPTLPGPLPGPPGSDGTPVPASVGSDHAFAPSPPTRGVKPAPPTSPRPSRRPVAASTPPPPAPEPVPAAPHPAAPAVADGGSKPSNGRADRRSARRAERQGDPLAGMTPLSPPPPRPWSARQPVDAPALDVPDPEPPAEPDPEPGGRARRSERRLPVR